MKLLIMQLFPALTAPPPKLVLPSGREVNFHTYSKDRLKFSSVYLNPNVFRLQVERQKL